MAHALRTIEKSESWFFITPKKSNYWGTNETISPKVYAKVKSLYKEVSRQKEIDVASLPFALKKAINESYCLLELTDDWDGEGSLGYSKTTLTKAIKFLKENAKNYFLNSGIWVTAPDICPGPDGSIDLLWKLDDRELLINIPLNENNLAGYYGDNFQNGSIIKGKLNLAEKSEWILMWLMK